MVYCNIHTHSLSQNSDDIVIVNRTIREQPEETSAPLQSVGIHPWYIYNVREQVEELRKAILQPQVVAIGEAGLDKLTDTPFEIQHEAFLAQAQLAEEHQKPFIIHCVKAWQELMAAKKQYKPATPWIIHGFRGNGELAEQLIHHGFYLSFGEHFNPEALKAAWPNHLLTETDDKETEISAIYQQITQSLSIEPDQFSLQIRENVRQLFSV